MEIKAFSTWELAQQLRLEQLSSFTAYTLHCSPLVYSTRFAIGETYFYSDLNSTFHSSFGSSHAAANGTWSAGGPLALPAPSPTMHIHLAGQDMHP